MANLELEGAQFLHERDNSQAVNSDSTLDPYITGVLESKLTEFGKEGELYKQKVSDMKRMTEITNKKDPLSIEDLRFLYEIDGKIVGFGYRKDPRIEEVLKGRNIRGDLSRILGCRENQISFTTEEALSGDDIEYHYGDLDLKGRTSAEGLELPNSVSGDLDLRALTSAEGLELPNSVGVDLNLEGLTSVERKQLRKTYPNLSIYPNP